MSTPTSQPLIRHEEENPTPHQIGQLRRLDEIHIDELLYIVTEKGASDLHLCAYSEPIIRVDGQLMRLNYEKATPTETQRLIYDILTDEQIQRFESALELDFSYSLAKVARFRVNVYRDKGAVAAAFRLIPARVPTIRELNLPPILEELTRRPRGLILVTGPTGSGKSTTLAAMINQINSERSCHIITIEDPIEYLHTHKFSIINQRELGQDTKAFAAALRSALREDPDVILVGEMRDADTIRWAMTAAETGHLVLGTLHTTGAVKTIDRLVDALPADEREQTKSFLANSLLAVITQVLVRTADQRGRKAICEIMVLTKAIGKLIMTDQTHQIPSQLLTGKDLGMQILDQSLMAAVQAKEIDPDDAYVYAQDKKAFARFVTDTSMLPKFELAPG